MMENQVTWPFLFNMRQCKDDCKHYLKSYKIFQRSSCAITDVESHSVVITGGLFVEDAISSSNKVARYDEGGFVGDMPSLLVARHRHGCGSFFRDDGSQVGN